MSDVSGGRPGRPQTVFTPEVLAAIPRWSALGADRREIAEVLGTTVNSLTVTCVREGIVLNDFRTTTAGLQRALRSDRWLKVQRAAARRSVPVAQLIVSLIEAVADDDMFDSVLDDLED